MRRTAILLVLVAGAAFAAGRLSRGGEPEEKPGEPVSALRYRIFLSPSVLHWSRGSGHWSEEIHFPEQKIVANLTFDLSEYVETGHLKPVLSAFEGGIRTTYKVRPSGPDTTAETETVEVDPELAEKIFAFVELSKRQLEASNRLGAECREAGLLRLVDDYLKKCEESAKARRERKADGND